jgi:hypothetical protein
MLKNQSPLILFAFTALFVASCSNSKQATQQPEETVEIMDEAVTAESIAPLGIAPFLGVWSGPENYPLVELTYQNDTFRIRECYGLNAEDGVAYFGEYKDGKVTAIGKEENFYKYTLPTFELKNNILIYNSGLGPMDLQKSTEQMPTIAYGKPVNND